MIRDKTILAIIPARGGSKGIHRKNIRPVAGRPLIAWAIEEAKKSRYIDRLILSSEDEEIMNIASEWGCDVPFKRPAELARDDTPMIDAILHALNALGGKFFYTVLLQPTSPLRNVDNIDACIEICDRKPAHACVSVTEPDKSPYWMYRIDDENHLIPLLDSTVHFALRQGTPKVYVPNGAVYVAETDFLRNSRSFITNETIAYIMPKEQSVDLDTELDMEICKILLSRT